MKKDHVAYHLRTLTLAMLLLCLPGSLLAQKKKKDETGTDDYTKDASVTGDMLYEDHIYKSNIRTVQLHRADW